MNKLTAALVALLVVAAVIAQRDHAAYRRHVAGWEKPPSANPPYAPPFVPGQCKGWHPQMTIVPVPMHLDSELP